MVNKMELVDREKLIAQYSANSESKGFMELVQDDCVVEALKKAEVVDAVPVVHGRWIMKETCGPHTGAWHCSVCDKVPRSLCSENYCPNCGAKMDLK